MNLAHLLNTLLGSCFVLLTLAVGQPAAAETGTYDVVNLALVGPDTLTTTDLKIELGIMENQQEDGGRSVLPEAESVLRRLIQNRLVMQEGYRMGLHEEFTVSNQVIEFVRHKMMASLLDSVAATAPADAPDPHEARRLAVNNYLTGLERRYNVAVDSTLLASLDYGSADKEVQKRLREDKTVLAVVPRGQLTVEGFSRILRFTEFHGLVGKVDAAQKRDRQFEKWLGEAVLLHQIELQKMAELPAFVTMATRLENTLVLQEALRLLVAMDFEPDEAAIQAYYDEHLDEFKPAPRVKMESLKTGGHEAAAEIRQRIQSGTPLAWLRKNLDTVAPGAAPFPAEFFAPDKLGLKPEEVELGWVPEPYQVPDGWVVAQIAEIEDPAPIPLASCRDQVIAKMKSLATRDLMIDILARLEAATPVTILPGAVQTVEQVVAEFMERNAPTEETKTLPSQEG